LKFCAYLQELGAPLPRVLAVYRQRGPAPDRTVRLGGSADVIRYLSDTGDYPLFVKPVRGAHGREAVAIRGISADGTRLELLSGTRLSTVGFAESMARAPGKGYLLQELLRTHARVGDICGDRLTSLRFVVLLAEDGPRILSVVWRVPTGTNVTDNFNVGFSGNLVARVDPATGGVAGIVQGAGWDVRPVDRHPDTGAVFAGLRLPDWERARALCTEYAAHFPDLRLQHWDIALTDRGPTILELNVAGGLRTHQIVASGPENLRVLSRFGR
ncbi:MAG: sugar-transfer associated ATP-grasp domain-containing protein, partial [Gammaproteobacteria bacterium]